MMPRRLAPGSPPVPRRPRRGELSLARVESFSDSVFAFAMTLLVLGLVVPKVAAVRSNAELLRQLGRQWPTFVAYLVSFVLIGQVWLQHAGSAAAGPAAFPASTPGGRGPTGRPDVIGGLQLSRVTVS